MLLYSTTDKVVYQTAVYSVVSHICVYETCTDMQDCPIGAILTPGKIHISIVKIHQTITKTFTNLGRFHNQYVDVQILQQLSCASSNNDFSCSQSLNWTTHVTSSPPFLYVLFATTIHHVHDTTTKNMKSLVAHN